MSSRAAEQGLPHNLLPFCDCRGWTLCWPKEYSSALQGGPRQGAGRIQPSTAQATDKTDTQTQLPRCADPHVCVHIPSSAQVRQTSWTVEWRTRSLAAANTSNLKRIRGGRSPPGSEAWQWAVCTAALSHEEAAQLGHPMLWQL